MGSSRPGGGRRSGRAQVAFLRTLPAGVARRRAQWRGRPAERPDQAEFLRRLWHSSRDQWRRATLIAVALWSVYSLILSPDGALRLLHLQRDVQVLEEEIIQLDGVRDSLGQFLLALDQGDPFALERVARERYGMAREHEQVLRLGRETITTTADKKQLTIDPPDR
jgi:cell division protein FtsB